MKPSNKYLWFKPKGGLNDQLQQMYSKLSLCKKYNRILLIDTTKSCYRINFSDYFDLNCPGVIYDINKIVPILNKNTKGNTVIADGWTQCRGSPSEFDIFMKKNIDAKIIQYSSCGGGTRGFIFFKENVIIKNSIKVYCKKKYSLIKNKKYLSIQIRNAEIEKKCNYEQLYNDNKKLVHSYDTIYIATDDPRSLDFFKSKKLNIVNFNVWPDNFKKRLERNQNLHYANQDPDIKIKCLFCDIYMITMSDKLLTNSKGGFKKFVQNCHKHKQLIKKKFD